MTTDALWIRALRSLPAIRKGHFGDVKIETADLRVSLSRMTVEDGETKPIYVEVFQGGGWSEPDDIPWDLVAQKIDEYLGWTKREISRNDDVMPSEIVSLARNPRRNKANLEELEQLKARAHETKAEEDYARWRKLASWILEGVTYDYKLCFTEPDKPRKEDIHAGP